MCEGFSKRWEKCPQPKPCAKTSRREPSKNKTDQTMKKTLSKSNIFLTSIRSFSDLPRSWQRGLNRNQRGKKCHCYGALPLWNTGAPTLNTSIKKCRQEISLSPCLSKPRDRLNQSPIVQPATFTSLPIVPGQNKQDSRFEDKCCLKGQAVFEQAGTKPHVDIHLHIWTLPQEA